MGLDQDKPRVLSAQQKNIQFVLRFRKAFHFLMDASIHTLFKIRANTTTRCVPTSDTHRRTHIGYVFVWWSWASRWPCSPSLNKQNRGLLHFPHVTEAKSRHCAAHRAADTATQPCQGFAAGSKSWHLLKEVAWRVTGSWQSSCHVALQNLENLCSAHPSVSNNKRNNEAVKCSMTLPGPTTMRMTAFISLPSATGVTVLCCELQLKIHLKEWSPCRYKIQMFD